MVNFKIFGVGLYRTGTSSLHLALHQLGLRSVHHHQLMKMTEEINRDRGRPLLWGIIDQYDSFMDGLIMYRFAELDRQYPNNKFICTMRDEESWVKSILDRRADDTQRKIPMLEDISEEAWRELYNDHYTDVQAYFRGRPLDVLYINICQGEGWEKLGQFLGVEVPEGPFPHENAAAAAVSRFWKPVGG